MQNTNQIWHDFHERLHNFIKSKIDDISYSEDILHEVFIKIHKNKDKLNSVKKLDSWIYKITRNTIIDYYRNHKNNIDLSEVNEFDQIETTPENEINILSCIDSLVSQLPTKYKSAIQITDINGKTQKELAQIENISLSGAKSRVQRGRVILKKLLQECCNFELNNQNIRCDCTNNKPF